MGPAGKGLKKVVPATGAAHTRHTVLGDAALKKGENRTLDFLPQKTMTRLEVSGQFLANASKPDSRSR